MMNDQSDDTEKLTLQTSKTRIMKKCALQIDLTYMEWYIRSPFGPNC